MMIRLRSRRPFVSSLLVLAVILLLTLSPTGCSQEQLDEFRAASADALGSGVQSILTGIIDGLVEVYTPDTASGDGS